MAYEYDENIEEVENEEVLEEDVDERALEDTEDVEVEDNNEETEEVEQEEEKRFTQEDIDRIINKKTAQARRRQEAENEQYNELIHTIKNGMQFDDEDISLADLNRKMKEAFEEQDVTIPEYHRGLTKHEQEVLANDRAKEVLDSGIEDVAEEYQRLRNKDTLSYAEQIQYSKYEKELAIYQAKEELEKAGKDSSVLESDEFIDFASKYKADISLYEIYDDFQKYTKKEVATPKPAGSVKGKSNKKQIKQFYSAEEASQFSTAELLRNPKLLDAINKSSEEW